MTTSPTQGEYLTGPVRECEIKYEITDDQELERIRNILYSNNFSEEEPRVESDLVPDVEDFLLRKNNLILRFRGIRNAKGFDILLTLKIGKTTTDGFQDAQELQYHYSRVEESTFAHINRILFERIGKVLPAEIHRFDNLEDLRTYLESIGFHRLRGFVEKKRTAYGHGTIVVTVDEFPQNIGTYIEIEAQTPEVLWETVALLQLPQDKLDARSYGAIISAKRMALPESERDTLVFLQNTARPSPKTSSPESERGTSAFAPETSAPQR